MRHQADLDTDLLTSVEGGHRILGELLPLPHSGSLSCLVSYLEITPRHACGGLAATVSVPMNQVLLTRIGAAYSMIPAQ